MSKTNRTMTERRQSSTLPEGLSESMMKPGIDFMEYLRSYCRKEPEAAAMWCLGIGFVLGWKLKLW